MTFFRVMPMSQLGRAPRPGSKVLWRRQAATNTCWATSSASLGEPSERTAMV